MHRRNLLRSLVGGSLVMPGILSELMAAGEGDPLAPKPGHFTGKAKRFWADILGGETTQ